MIPTIDERLASVVRALSEVIVPHLPEDASLAREQAQLAIGHIQIIRSQLDAAPAYEREERDDAAALGAALLAAFPPARHDCPALATLDHEIRFTKSDAREDRKAINAAITGVIEALGASDCRETSAALSRTVLDFEAKRTEKDRRWFAPFGFDTI